MKPTRADIIVGTKILSGNFIGTITYIDFDEDECEINFIEISTKRNYPGDYSINWILDYCKLYIEKSIEEQVIDKIKYLSSKFKNKQKLKHVSIP